MESIDEMLAIRSRINLDLKKAVSEKYFVFKKGMVVINPHYVPSLDNRVGFEHAWMLCIIAEIIPHPQRRLKVAFRLEALNSGAFITNASVTQLAECNSFLFK